MDGNRPFNRGVHLEIAHWQNISENNSVWHFYNNNEKSKQRREFVRSKILPFLNELLADYLTSRQYEVVELCLLNNQCTQTNAAKILGISQPTINQHLNGKLRNGKRIGGAYKRIGRIINNTDKNGVDCFDDNRLSIFKDFLFNRNLS